MISQRELLTKVKKINTNKIQLNIKKKRRSVYEVTTFWIHTQSYYGEMMPLLLRPVAAIS